MQGIQLRQFWDGRYIRTIQIEVIVVLVLNNYYPDKLLRGKDKITPYLPEGVTIISWVSLWNLIQRSCWASLISTSLRSGWSGSSWDADLSAVPTAAVYSSDWSPGASEGPVVYNLCHTFLSMNGYHHKRTDRRDLYQIEARRKSQPMKKIHRKARTDLN